MRIGQALRVYCRSLRRLVDVQSTDRCRTLEGACQVRQRGRESEALVARQLELVVEVGVLLVGCFGATAAQIIVHAGSGEDDAPGARCPRSAAKAADRWAKPGGA